MCLEIYLNLEEESTFIDYIQEIDESKKSVIRDLIGRAITKDELVLEIKTIYQEIKNSHTNNFSPWIIGALGYFLFSKEAEQYGLTNKEKHKNKANDILSDNSTIIDFIDEEYELNKPEFSRYDRDKIKLHKVGTTSYLFKMGKYALKLIKFRYMLNKKITSATKNYKENYKNLNPDFVPEVEESTEKFIIMKFIEGKNLREYLVEDLCNTKVAFNKRDHLEIIEKIIIGILKALKECSKLNISHLDLSPYNILLDENLKVYLVDFGRNYLLSERVGSVAALSKLQIFLAPELQFDTDPPEPVKADIYSLGFIFAELLNLIEIDVTNSAYLIDRTWMKFPTFGGVVEDMIDKESSNRITYLLYNEELQDVATITPEQIYEILIKKIEEEIRIISLTSESKTSFISDIFKYIFLNGYRRDIRDNIKIRLSLYDNKNKNRTLVLRLKAFLLQLPILSLLFQFFFFRGKDLISEKIRLLVFVKNTIFIHYLILLTFFVFILDDFNLLYKMDYIAGVPIPGGDFLLDLIHSRNEVIPLSLNHKIWGRIVGLSFSLVASTYYLNIFKLLSIRKVFSNPSHPTVKRLKGLTLRTEFWLRFNSICFSLPILWAIVINPSDWHYCSAVGIYFVTLNNYHTQRLSSLSLQLKNQIFCLPQSNSLDDFKSAFNKWWLSMFGYASFIVLIGILLNSNLANDYIIYAAGVVTINIIFLYLNASISQASYIKAGIGRSFSVIERISKMLELNKGNWKNMIEQKLSQVYETK